MRKTITMTSKGQVTLPAALRHKMGLNDGDKLLVRFEPKGKSVVLSRPMDIDQLSDYLSANIPPGTPPATNVHEIYEQGRIEDMRKQDLR
jgi:AbrB family looped-hinge helix DNA binding protein